MNHDRPLSVFARDVIAHRNILDTESPMISDTKSETSALTWILALLALMFAGIAFFYFNKQKPVPPTGPSYVRLEEVRTHIDGDLFIRANIALELRSRESELEVNAVKANLRGVAVKILTNASEEQLSGKGRHELSRQMLKRFNEILGTKLLGDVLFTDFVVGMR